MNRFLTVFILLLTCHSFAVLGQPNTVHTKNTQISGAKLIKADSNNLILIGKIWGFLKYHHPQVAKGDYDWDQELFKLLPRYVAVKNSAERDTLLLKWIDDLGPVALCTQCKATAKNAFLKPDQRWISHSGLSSKLSQKLQFVYDNRHQGENHYVTFAPQIGNPVFQNEKAYADMPYPDARVRLLALYRYWNMIHYYFPYKHLISGNWHDRLGQYLPKFIKANNELDYEKAAVQLIGEVKDTHANLWRGHNALQNFKGHYYPPVHVRMIENQLVVVDYYSPEMATMVGLEIGDVITTIDDQNVGDMITALLPFYPASNYPTQLRDISQNILRGQTNAIDISYVRDGKSHSKQLGLYKRDQLDYYHWYRRDKNGKSFKMLFDNIGYVTLKNIKDADVKDIKEQFVDTKGIIIDIRNYPSAFMPFALGPFFTPERTPFVKFTKGNINNPGEFTFGKTLSIPGNSNAYKGKLVVLVNELTQSQAEYTTMAFRAGANTTVIGSTTAGADGNISPIELPGGLRTMISGIGVYYPDGTETQVVGIVPDITVKPTLAGIKAGQDELLDKAIEHIKYD